MKKNNYFIGCILSVFLSLTVQAQNTDTEYLYPDYQDAIICFKGGAQSSEKVNYNRMNHKIYFIDKKDQLVREVADTRTIVAIKVGQRTFVAENEGISEVLATQPTIYVQYRVSGRPKAPGGAYGGTSVVGSINTYSEFQEGGARAKLKEYDKEKSNSYNYYWIEKGGKKKQFKNFKQFLKLYSAKELLQQYIDEHKPDFEDVGAIVSLCLYAESL